jgi:hypothetical protein
MSPVHARFLVRRQDVPPVGPGNFYAQMDFLYAAAPRVARLGRPLRPGHEARRGGWCL